MSAIVGINLYCCEEKMKPVVTEKTKKAKLNVFECPQCRRRIRMEVKTHREPHLPHILTAKFD